jgi:hypothetical protein
VVTQPLRKSRRDLDTDIHHHKSFCCTFKTWRFMSNNFSKQPNMIPNVQCSILRCVLYRLHNPPVVLFSFLLNSFYFNIKLIWY